MLHAEEGQELRPPAGVPVQGVAAQLLVARLFDGIGQRRGEGQVLLAAQQGRLHAAAVAPRPARLLEVGLGGIGQLQVDHGSDVRLVHTHAVGGGGDEHPIGGAEKPPFHPGPLGGLQAGVIEAQGQLRPAPQELPGRALGAEAAAAEAQQRPRRVHRQSLQFAHARERRHHAVAQIGPVRVARHQARGQAGEQRLPDGRHGVGAGRGREGAAAARPELIGQGPQPQIGRAEARAPLGHAVGLVHHPVGDGQTPQQRGAAPLKQRLGGGVQQPHGPAAQLGQDAASALRILPSGQGGGGQAAGAAGAQLVLEQRAQGHHDHAQAGEQQGRQLEAQGLAGPGRQQHDLIVALQDVGDHEALDRVEIVDAEAPAGGLRDGVRGARRGPLRRRVDR